MDGWAVYVVGVMRVLQPNAYVTDVSYPCHFHRQLQPLWLKTQASFLGVESAKIEKGYRYCELGCATGINLLVSAYCHPEACFVGVDFNPQHIDFAQKAARELGLKNVEFICQDFAKFAAHAQPSFDVMVCHGVWSWVAFGVQQSLLTLAKALLKEQGLLYVHYMSHPGSSHLVPLQKLIFSVAQNLSGDSSTRLREALKTAKALAADGLIAVPHAREHLTALSKLDSQYLAHDLLAEHFSVAHSVDMHAMLQQYGFYYLASADPWHNSDALSVPKAIHAVLARTEQPALREQLKDHARHQHQRQDLFQKAPKVLSREAHIRALLAIRFVRLKPLTPLVLSAIGPIELPPSMIAALDRRLATGAAAVHALIEDPDLADHQGLLHALQLLMSHGFVHPCSATSVDVSGINQWFSSVGIRLAVDPDCASATFHNNEAFSYAASPSSMA